MKERRRAFLWIGLIFLALALRVWRLDVQDIWWDEARNIDVALRPLAAIPGAPELDIHPPGYFILLHLWMNVAGHTAFATRFFSVWFGVLLLPLLAALARRLRLERTGVFAALYAALSPFLIGEAQETRMYTLAFVLLALTAIALWDTLRGRSRAWVGLGVLTAASVLVHYSTVFVLVALYAFALLVALYQASRPAHHTSRVTFRVSRFTLHVSRLIYAGLLSLVLFLPQAPRAYQQIAPYGNPNLVVPTLREYLTQLWRAYTVGVAAEGVASRVGVWLFGAVMVGIGYWMWEDRNRRSERASRPRPTSHPPLPTSHSSLPTPHPSFSLLFLLWSILLPVGMYYLVLLRRATFAPRYISFVVPFLALLLGMALAGWWQWRRAVGGVLVAGVVLALAAGIWADQFNPAYFREDTSGLARWLMQNTTGEDLVLIDVPYPLGFYYPRYSKDPDFPPPVQPAHIAPAYYMFVDIHHVDERLNQLAAGKKRIFWVQWFKSDTDPRGAVEFLLRKYGVHAGRTAFRGYTVDWYRVLPNAHYRLAEGMRPQRITFAGRLATVAVAAAQAPRLPAPILRASDEGMLPRPVWAVVDWQRIGSADRPYKVSARLSDPLDQVIAQDDRRLVNDRHLAPPYWTDEDVARNVYLLRLPLGTPPGMYTLTLRVYDPETLAPLSAEDATGRSLGTDADVVTVRVAKAGVYPSVTPIALADAPIALVEYEVKAEEAPPGGTVPLHLLWLKQTQTQEGPLRIQLALMDPAGNTYSVGDMDPVPWYPTDRWDVGEIVRGDIPWRLAPDTPGGTYTVRLRLLDRERRILGETSIGRVTVKGRPHRFTAPPLSHPLTPPPAFDDIGLLLGYDLAGEIAPGASVPLTLTWQALNPAHVDYKISVQVLDAANRVLAQEDHIPLRGGAPTTSWLPGEILQDRFDLTLPAELPPGPKRVIVLMYEAETLRRVPVTVNGRDVGDYVTLAEKK